MKKVKEGYKMTELGDIPNSWKVEKIGNIFDFYGGISISRDKQSENGVYYLHYGDIHKKNRNYFSVEEDCNWLPKIEIDTNDLKEGILLNTGDVVFADASEDYEGIGKSVVIINEKNEDFVSGLHTIVAKDKGKELDTLYKKYCFGTTEVRKQFRTLATGATVYGISRSNIKDIKILVPTIEEQEQIALTLSSVDEQIEITDNLIEKTKELKKGLMQKLLTKGIGHSRFKDTEIGKIPEEWEIRRLGDIGEIVTGSTPKTAEKDNYGSEYLWVSPTDMGEKKYIIKTNKMLSKMGFEKTRKLPKGSILVTCIGSTIGKIGISGYELSTNQQINSIICKSNFDNEFIYYIIDFNFSNYMSYISTQAVPIINKTTFSEFQIQVPPVEEQRKISLILSSVDKQIDQYESKKEKLQELKKGLMQKLLTGRIRVKV